MAKNRPVVELMSGGGYAEIYSGGGLQFNLLHPDTMKALHFPTMCKDFFTDAFYSEATGRNTSIWGFNWKPGMLPKDARKHVMALRYKGKKLGEKADAIQDFLNRWEKAMDLPLSTVTPDSTGDLAVITFDAAWPVRPVMVSLLTLLMRLAPGYDGTPVPKFLDRIVKEGNPFGQYDQSELKKEGVVDLLVKTFESGQHPHPKQTFKQYSDPHGCHHSGGFIAYTTGRATG